MQALAIFSRSDNAKNLYLLPVMVEVSQSPLSKGFDSYDYNGRAWQAMVDAGETDPQGIVPASTSSPSLEFITAFNPGIRLNQWTKVDSSLRSRIVDAVVADLYTKESFLEQTKLELPESVSFSVHRADNSTGIEVRLTCQSTPLDTVKVLVMATEQYNNFIRGERYPVSKDASVLVNYVTQAFKGI
ncbi:hypothetical protein P3447_09430 [Vibrio parahaemolyticus]|nr:hypothetical protein [Vibrio parahaemolyticus]